MLQFLTDTKVQLLLWKLAIARFILYTIAVLINSFLTANASIVWGSLDGFEKFIVILGCVGSWSTTMIAFLDRTSSQLSKGELPSGVPDKNEPKPQ